MGYRQAFPVKDLVGQPPALGQTFIVGSAVHHTRNQVRVAAIGAQEEQMPHRIVQHQLLAGTDDLLAGAVFGARDGVV
jgi:hypothetical protein